MSVILLLTENPLPASGFHHLNFDLGLAAFAPELRRALHLAHLANLRHHNSATRWFYICRVCLCVCLPDVSKMCGPISMNFSWFTGVIGRRERIKTSGKFRHLCVKLEKTVQNSRFWESTHGPQALDCAMTCDPSSRARLHAGRLRHGPITRWPGGVARSLRWGTVSNTFGLLSPV